MWGVGLCCQITSAPDLPKEQVGTWLQQFPCSEHSGAMWIKCGAQQRVGRPAEGWPPAWHVLCCGNNPHRNVCGCT